MTVTRKKPVAGCGFAAVLEDAVGGSLVLQRVWAVGNTEKRRTRCRQTRASRSCLARHFQVMPLQSVEAAQERCALPNADDELAFYRKSTEALLRRYQRTRMGMGRVPARMSGEARGAISHTMVRGFDDAVIFCADVERCLRRLNADDQHLLERIAVQEYTMAEAAGLLGMSLRKCIVMYRRALDRGTRLLLKDRLLDAM